MRRFEAQPAALRPPRGRRRRLRRCARLLAGPSNAHDPRSTPFAPSARDDEPHAGPASASSCRATATGASSTECVESVLDAGGRRRPGADHRRRVARRQRRRRAAPGGRGRSARRGPRARAQQGSHRHLQRGPARVGGRRLLACSSRPTTCWRRARSQRAADGVRGATRGRLRLRPRDRLCTDTDDVPEPADAADRA